MQKLGGAAFVPGHKNLMVSNLPNGLEEAHGPRAAGVPRAMRLDEAISPKLAERAETKL